MKRLVPLALAIAALAAPVASAKEGAQARLLAPVPAHATPGTQITVRWSVDVPGAKGRRRPFGAFGMFVRLRGRNGGSTTATATQGAPPYEVRVRVPAGGIRSIRFGLMGTRCDPAGCRPSPIFFPLR